MQRDVRASEISAPRIIVASGMSGTGVSYVAAQLQTVLPALSIVDAGSTWNEIAEACAPGFARMIVISTQDIIAITSAYALIKLTRDQFSDAPLEILVNASEEREGLRTYERIQVACSHFLGETVGYAGAVPMESMEQAPGEKQALHTSHADGGARAVAALRNLATRLDDELGATEPAGSWRHGERRVAL